MQYIPKSDADPKTEPVSHNADPIVRPKSQSPYFNLQLCSLAAVFRRGNY